jgi:hypothetical protein
MLLLLLLLVFRSEKEQLRLDDRLITYFIYQSLRKGNKRNFVSFFNDLFDIT